MISTKQAAYILDNLTTAVLWFRPDLTLHTLNPAAETLLEVSAKQACGLGVEQLFPRADHCHQALKRVREQRYCVTERGVRLHLFGAKTITVDCSITPVIVEQNIRGVLLELMRIDQHLRITREENLLLQQQAARNVIRGLAHEIKNPLGGLRGAAQLLARELPDKNLREYTDIIIGEADRLQNLLNRMLLPQGVSHKKLTNIHQIIIRVSQIISSEPETRIKIEYDFDPSIPELYLDPDQMIQALLNIMRNAVQALNGFGKIQICTRIQRQMSLGGRHHKLLARIDVRDNGPGIAPHLIDHIFYPLVTSRAEGTGLGLSIAQSLVNQHGGLIECTSQPGDTVFTIWLPMETEKR
ncbi:nitrogen regulation protein NR(II) [Thioflexithrix psekupsensis]|uniref:histidine kinase n=1 Tax=Thioflexithrix psekupsensis TaxID=1570016 RepID=A0A251X864_9GAMM|nr:nitrogen regulation protein NR(II) [Thioflexithrix psekupsensis]OUD13984.1 two-component system sensor histidine kinase NtrB [Thioflexithrix psekupsensis]